MKLLFYILDDDHQIVSTNDLLHWAKWFEESNTVVAYHILNNVRVSTVFLGLDHNFSGHDGTPILFETAIFFPGRVDIARRYATWKDAETGHKEVLALCIASEYGPTPPPLPSA